MDLSVLICTRNGSATVAEAIRRLGQQDVRPDAFEVIVIDNGSTDDTWSVATAALQSLRCPTTILKERTEGKVKAMIRGILTAKAPLVSIVDDDNFVCPAFVSRSIDMFQRFPKLGVVGSHNSLVSSSIPDWFPWAAGRYGCAMPWLTGDVRTIDEYRTIASKGVIAGAGSTVRKEGLLVALANDFDFINDTYRGRRMSVTGEDTELCMLYEYLGFWFGTDTRITLEHKVHPSRLTWDYARQLSRSIGAGGIAVDAHLWLADPSSSPRHGTWWWMALRRLRRLAKLLPAVLIAKITRTTVAPLWITWEVQCGGLRRLLATRGEITRMVHSMRTSRWATLRGRYGATA